MPQDKLTAVRIKQENGEYGPQIPVAAKAENVEYDKEYSVKEVLGDININKGPLQKQIEDINTSTIQAALEARLDEWEEQAQIPVTSVIVDSYLTNQGQAADAKQAGKVVTINNEANGNATKLHLNTSNDIVNIALMDDLDTRINRPIKNGQYDNGEQGQLLRTNGDGSTEWVDEGLPTDAQVQVVVDAWMDEHSGQYVIPDGNITENKLNDELKLQTIKDYVTPEMFGAKGDGTTDDTEFINLALNSGNSCVLFSKPKYKITQPLSLPDGIILISFNSEFDTYVAEPDYLFVNSTNTEYPTYLSQVTIYGLTIVNKNTAVNHIQPGQFADRLDGCVIDSCKIKGFSYVFGPIIGLTKIINNTISGIYKRVFVSCADSIISNNYINASRYGIEESIVISSSANTTTFSNNFVDFFRDCFHISTGTGFSVIGNRFDRCVNIFHDNVTDITASNNLISNLRYDASNWGVLTEQQKTQLSQEKWSVFKFDKALNSNIKLIKTNFSQNILRDCQYYIYVGETTSLTPVYDVYLRDNVTISSAATAPNRYEYTIADAGFTNHQNTYTTYHNKTMTSVYFDFWDMKEYETLPSPLWINGTTRSVKTFKGMKAIYQGHVYVNYNQEWVRVDYTDSELTSIIDARIAASAS